MSSERPILFSADMVRAILDNRKSQTRRVIKSQPGDEVVEYYFDPDEEFLDPWRGKLKDGGTSYGRKCPYGKVGDLLWVRETWAVGTCADKLKPSELDPPTWLKDNGGLWYKVGLAEPQTPISTRGRWRSGRFMMKWAARIWLEITNIRVEILKEISDKDIICEGFEIREDFFGTIIKINQAKNPEEFLNKWVWVIEFKRVEH